MAKGHWLSLTLAWEKKLKSVWLWIHSFWPLFHGFEAVVRRTTLILFHNPQSLFPDGHSNFSVQLEPCPEQLTEAVIIRLYHFSFPGWDTASGLPWPLLPLLLNSTWDMGSPPRMSRPFAMPLWASRNGLLSLSSEPSPSMAWVEHQVQVYCMEQKNLITYMVK